ncbi:MAG: hypothetical protein ACI92E_001260 [Oceanicoccus sp.]|jgi:hypothetical protein
MSDNIDRRLERKELSQSIVIDDVINGGEFGELINLTTEGMMAITSQAIPTHSIFQLSLRLPEEINGSNIISLGVDGLWCKKAENFQRYWAGFQIIDASELALAQVKILVAEYSK